MIESTSLKSHGLKELNRSIVHTFTNLKEQCWSKLREEVPRDIV